MPLHVMQPSAECLSKKAFRGMSYIYIVSGLANLMACQCGETSHRQSLWSTFQRVSV